MTLPALRNDTVIARLEAARTQLAEAQTIQQTKSISDVAAAAEIYARRQQLGQEAIDFAHSIRIEALRKVGEMLKETPKNTGVAGGGTRSAAGSTKELADSTPTLADLGLDKKTSSIAQKLADLPAEQFNAVRDGHESIGKAIAQVGKDRKPDSKSRSDLSLQEKHEALVEDYKDLQQVLRDLDSDFKSLERATEKGAAEEMKSLREELRLAYRRRDELMVESAEKTKQIRYWEREAKRLGWKPKK